MDDDDKECDYCGSDMDYNGKEDDGVCTTESWSCSSCGAFSGTAQTNSD
jgi:hypothetical protein